MAKASRKTTPTARPLLGAQLAAALEGKAIAIVAPSELRNRELEAAIAAAPDDTAGYLVYGDWLQERGDPRGTLIALFQAAGQEPDTKATRGAITRLLAEHDHAFTGVVGQYVNGAGVVEVEWWLGFWRRAVLRFERRDKLEVALRELLAHPSACLLQELLIELPSARGQILEPARIVELLLAARPHPPLRRLQLGPSGAWTIPDVIHAAYPRLRQDDRAVWAAVLDRLAGERAIKLRFDPVALPALVPCDPHANLVIDPRAIASGLKAEVDKGRDLGLVVAMRQVFTPESRDRFAHALVAQWFAAAERPADRWMFELVGTLGGDHCAAFLGGRLAEDSHQRAVQAIDQLARIASDAAVVEIVALSIMPSRFLPRRAAADDALVAIAARRGIAVATLVARGCPRSVVPEAANRLIGTQRRWLFDLMIHGRQVAVGDFLEHVAHHTLRGPLAAGLVWGRITKGERPEPFRLDPSAHNAPIDLAGAPVALTDGQVCVIHPVELDDHARAAWQQAMAMIEQSTPETQLVPPFEQLDRPLFGFTDDELEAGLVVRFARFKAGFHAIRDGLQRSDWTAYVDHGVEAFARYYERGDVTLVASLPGGAVAEVWAQRGRDPAPSAARRAPLTRVPRVVASEALYDLARAVGASRPAPARVQASPVARGAAPPADGVVGLPQRGRHPFAELAKSSRSTCVICELKIEKQTMRIGVERVIETPAFSGRATAWLHAGCRDRCPELADVEDLDARLTHNSDGVWPRSA